MNAGFTHPVKYWQCQAKITWVCNTTMIWIGSAFSNKRSKQIAFSILLCFKRDFLARLSWTALRLSFTRAGRKQNRISVQVRGRVNRRGIEKKWHNRATKPSRKKKKKKKRKYKYSSDSNSSETQSSEINTTAGQWPSNISLTPLNGHLVWRRCFWKGTCIASTETVFCVLRDYW